MMNVTELKAKSRYDIRAQPLNCSAKLGEVGSDKKCPHCNQFHLRAGYCQALDPINADQYPHLHKRFNDETDDAPETDSETDAGALSCVECGDPFNSKRANARYCSPACRLKAHRRAAAKEST
jgi:hypothetical protein